MFSQYSTHFVILFVIALICGWLAGIVTRGAGFGLLGNSLVALAGALGTFYLTRAFGAHHYLGFFGTALTAFIGAFFLLALISQSRR
jgi:uncharacterized membrane protein YeaQ/YmgE (transglycosylase-associated protein family)